MNKVNVNKRNSKPTVYHKGHFITALRIFQLYRLCIFWTLITSEFHHLLLKTGNCLLIQEMSRVSASAGKLDWVTHLNPQPLPQLTKNIALISFGARIFKRYQCEVKLRCWSSMCCSWRNWPHLQCKPVPLLEKVDHSCTHLGQLQNDFGNASWN